MTIDYNHKETLNERKNDPRYISFVSINEEKTPPYDMRLVENDLKELYNNVLSVRYEKTNVYRFKSDTDEGENMGNFEVYLSSLDNINSICKTVYDNYGWFIVMIKIDNVQFIDWNRNGTYTNEEPYSVFKGMEMRSYLRNIKKGNFNVIKLIFEAEITVEDFDYTDLYHLTERKNLENIIVKGLVPTSNGNFTERVYFGKNVDILKSLFEETRKDPVILRLNLEKYGDEIRNNIKLYKDPRMESADFTYSVINPKYIQILDDNGYFKNLLDDISIDEYLDSDVG